MERQELEVFSHVSNFAIVRMPGRNFPGCVIQGDSLCILLHAIKEVGELAQSTGNHKLINSIAEIESNLAARLDHYEEVLNANGIEIPYVR